MRDNMYSMKIYTFTLNNILSVNTISAAKHIYTVSDRIIEKNVNMI